MREAAVVTAPSLEFTGERIVPGKTAEPLFREHEERYVFAGQYVAGKSVLDVACGTGVGTDYLRTAGAVSCHGIDIDLETIQYAKTRYPRCCFAQGDALRVKLPDNSVDVVVSFETIEHISDQRKFISECKRVLRSDGLLVCSTPNTKMYGLRGKNPYHVRELTEEKFVDLLAAHFGEVHLFGQATRVYPLHWARQFVVHALHRLNLKERLKEIVRMRAPHEMRHEFSINGGVRDCEIRRYERAWLRQPIYLVAVARS